MSWVWRSISRCRLLDRLHYVWIAYLWLPASSLCRSSVPFISVMWRRLWCEILLHHPGQMRFLKGNFTKSNHFASIIVWMYDWFRFMFVLDLMSLFLYSLYQGRVMGGCLFLYFCTHYTTYHTILCVNVMSLYLEPNHVFQSTMIILIIFFLS